MYVCMYVSICMCMHVYVCVCVYVYVCVCVYVRVCVYVYVCMYVCLYLCTYVCIYVIGEVQWHGLFCQGKSPGHCGDLKLPEVVTRNVDRWTHLQNQSTWL